MTCSFRSFSLRQQGKQPSPIWARAHLSEHRPHRSGQRQAGVSGPLPRRRRLGCEPLPHRATARLGELGLAHLVALAQASTAPGFRGQARGPKPFATEPPAPILVSVMPPSEVISPHRLSFSRHSKASYVPAPIRVIPLELTPPGL
ncbi:hypothetical protein NL676_003786 [Syzygium grande]|nr:hypothetical protein NL676_003786 [Syzygium grande]